MSAVWEHSQHSANALLLLLAVADYADDNGVAWPGFGRLAEKTRTSRRHVVRLMDDVTKSGELWAMNRDKQRSNIYIVTPGLTLPALIKGLHRARDLGVNSTRGSDTLSLPPQVLVVVTGCPYQQAEKVATSDLLSPSGDTYVTTLVTPMSPDPSLSTIKREVEDKWKPILDELKLQTPEATFASWLADSELVADVDGTWTIQLKNDTALQWVNGRLRPLIERIMERQAPGVMVEFVP